MSGVSRSDESGFSLVELLVVILLLGVVGSVVVTGLVSAMRHTQESQQRIEAMAELQRAAERITRELRAACPVMDMADDDVTVAIHRDGDTRYHQFYRDGTQLRHAVKDTADETPAGGNVLINELPADALFTYFDDAAEPVDEPRDVRLVRMALRRDLPGQDRTVEVGTTTSLRNGGQACD